LRIAFQHLRLPILIVLLAGLACNFPAATPPATPRLTEAWMAQDYNGEQPTSIFGQQDTFYCIARLENSGAESAVRAVWTAISGEGVEPNTPIDQVELATRSGALHFELSNAGPWPVGVYQVELYLNGELDRTLEFIVQ